MKNTEHPSIILNNFLPEEIYKEISNCFDEIINTFQNNSFGQHKRTYCIFSNTFKKFLNY